VRDDRVDELAHRGVGIAEVDVDGGDVELVIRRDRPDVLLVDLVIVGDIPTVTDESRTSDLLVQHDSHLGLEPGHHVEVGDVDHVVTIELLLLVHGGRSRGPLGDPEELFLLQVALDVTLGTSLLGRDVGVDGLDPAERGLASSAEEPSNPLSPTLEVLRDIVDRDSIREQDIDILDAVLEVLLRIGLDGLTKRAALHGILNDAGDGVVRQNVHFLLSSLSRRLENVVGHHFTFLVDRIDLVTDFTKHVLECIDIEFAVCSLTLDGLDGLANHEVDDVLLLVGQAVVDVLDGFAIVVFIGNRSLCGTAGTSSMLELQTSVDDCIFVEHLFHSIAVADSDVLDESAGIGAGEDQADLTDCTVEDLLGTLNQLISPDRHHVDVAMLEKLTSLLCLLRLVEEAIGVDAVISVLENGMTQNVLRILVSVLPHERHLHGVLMLESARHDGTAVGALEPRLGGVAAEICFHFDFSFPKLGHRRIDRRIDWTQICVFTRHVAVSKFICLRI
jgi:hypothetical protein